MREEDLSFEQRWKIFDDPNLAHLFTSVLDDDMQFAVEHLKIVPQKKLEGVQLSTMQYWTVSMLIKLTLTGPHTGYDLTPILPRADQSAAFYVYKRWTKFYKPDKAIVAQVLAMFDGAGANG